MDTIATPTAPLTDLYWEARGSGPALLLIPGTPGYGGQLAVLAHELAGSHLVITYDRRGTGRSATPDGWARTTLAEQADDAAAVLSQVGVGTATVFGTSNGAAVALELALRHPGRVTRAILHEMPLMSVLEDPEPVVASLGALIGGAMAAGGPPNALEAFLRFAFGDAVIDSWTPDLRDRMLADAEMVFSVEMPAFQAYRPDPGRMAGCPVPVTVLVGQDEQMPFFHEAAQWLAERLGTTVGAAPGAHAAPFTAPAALARTIRDIEGPGAA